MSLLRPDLRPRAEKALVQHNLRKLSPQIKSNLSSPIALLSFSRAFDQASAVNVGRAFSGLETIKLLGRPQ